MRSERLLRDIKDKVILSVALATYNEESNIRRCLESVKSIADEIVVVDGTSKDGTSEIAKSLGARVIIKDNPSMFHINKQKAIDESLGDWILQLDADEVITPELAKEIKHIISMNSSEIEAYQKQIPKINIRLNLS